MEMQERCRNVLMSSRGLPDGNGCDCGRHHVNLPEEYGRECGRHHVNLPEEYGRECECHHVNLPEGDRRGMWMPAWFKKMRSIVKPREFICQVCDKSSWNDQ